MSRFDDTISTKLKQLNEIASGVNGAPAQNPALTAAASNPTGQANPTGASQTAQAAPTSPATPTGAADPTKAQETQAAQATDPGAELAKVFQTLKFSDPNSSVQAFNNAMKTAGNAPGIKEFFSSLAFDPTKGFLVAQPQSGAAPAK